jgi:hypothetical protein
MLRLLKKRCASLPHRHCFDSNRKVCSGTSSPPLHSATASRPLGDSDTKVRSMAAMFGEQVAVERIVAVAEDGLRAAVTALRDMVRMTGDDDTCEAAMAPEREESN